MHVIEDIYTVSQAVSIVYTILAIKLSDVFLCHAILKSDKTPFIEYFDICVAQPYCIC